MNEQSKAALRRLKDPRFKHRWFVGRGLDIGCGGDPLNPNIWPNIAELVPYDQIISTDMDANTLRGVDSSSFTFVHASHCLEHVHNPYEAVRAWLDVLVDGGFLIVTIPSWELYENRVWPSKFNHDHKTAWTLVKQPKSVQEQQPHVIYIPEFLEAFTDIAIVEHLGLLSDQYKTQYQGFDQTQGNAECAIEFVLQKQPNREALFTAITIDT